MGELLDGLKEAKRLVDSKKFSGLLVAGDFNLLKITWSEEFGLTNRDGVGDIENVFVDTLKDLLGVNVNDRYESFLSFYRDVCKRNFPMAKIRVKEKDMVFWSN